MKTSTLQYSKNSKIRVACLAFCLVFLLVDTAQALLPFTESDLQKVNVGQNYRDGEVTLNPQRCGSSLSTINNRIFYIGDSLTVGMVAYAGLLEKSQEAGLTADKNYDELARSNGALNRLVGASVEATIGSTVTKSLVDLAEHSGDLSPENAGIIVVGLGTNAENNFTSKIDEMIDYIRSINESANIYWVNTYFRPDEDTYKTVNESILEASENGERYTVVDFAAEAESNPDNYRLSDGIHNTVDGYRNKSDFILSQLGGGTGGGSSSCARSGTGDNERDAFDYLSGIYTPEIAAGIVANMRHESGVRPLRMECLFSVNQGVERYGLSADLIDPEYGGVRLANYDAVASAMLATGRCPNESRPKRNIEQLGWGLVQWTPASKMINPSRASGAADSLIEDIFFQLDFLVGQLNGEGQWAGTLDARAGSELMTATTAQQAAEIFAVRYERCGACDYGSTEVISRGEEAAMIMAQYGSPKP